MKSKTIQDTVVYFIRYCGSASFDADPVQTFHFDADPDPYADPTPSFTHGKSKKILILFSTVPV